MATIIVRYDWGDGIEWDVVSFALCPSYGCAATAHALLELGLANSDYIEIRDSRGSLWPLNRETLHTLLVWSERALPNFAPPELG